MGAETDRRLSTTDVGRAPLSLLACALAAGLLLGLLAPVTSQDGLDGSLVLAGIVHYPPQSPINQYFLGSWTIIHQLGALLLRAGLDQAYVSEIFFLVPCALLVGAYAAVVYCFSGQFLLSLLAAPLCFLANPLAKFFVSPDYAALGLLWTQPPVQTFGFWAHAGSVWVIGCVAAGRKALAGFSAVVLIAVHPVLGVYTVTLLTATLLAGRLFLGLDIRGFAKGAALGSLVAIASFAAYLTTRPDLSGPIDQAAYDAYMNAWDTHRSHVMTPEIAVRIAVAAAIATGALSVFLIFARPRRDAALQTSGLVMLAVIASTLAYFAMHLTPGFLPQIFTRAAPGRLLNVQAFLSTPMAVGLAVFAADQAAGDWTTEATASWLRRAISVVALVFVLAELTAHVLSRRDLMIDDVRQMAARGPREPLPPYLTAPCSGATSDRAGSCAKFWRRAPRPGRSSTTDICLSRSMSAALISFPTFRGPQVRSHGSWTKATAFRSTIRRRIYGMAGRCLRIAEDNIGHSFRPMAGAGYPAIWMSPRSSRQAIGP